MTSLLRPLPDIAINEMDYSRAEHASLEVL